MNTITLSRKDYNGSACIFIKCNQEHAFHQRIRNFPGGKWSQSNRCWYIDDREDSFRELIAYFQGDFKIDTRPLHNPPKYSNGANKPVKGYKGPYGPVEMNVGLSGGRITIRFLGRFDMKWIDEIKQYGEAYYKPDSKEWVLAASRITIDSLSEYFANLGIALYIKKSKPVKEIALIRDRLGSEVRKRELSLEGLGIVEHISRYLRERRFSESTINAYSGQIEFFFKYFNQKSPFEITNDDVSQFMDDYVIRLGFSISFQNQMISVLKAFSQLYGNNIIDSEDLSRPKRGRPLPQVFSKEEVSLILNSPRNLKHKLILWLIYSCGLRRSEALNIRLNDLNIERGILHIRSGKGNTDRVVPVSSKLRGKIEEYLVSYKPTLYFFEGQTGGKYTASSVHSIFKTALLKSGIKKEVGVHSLRHSYATHLHESGLDIRYIQELLGHKSSKTTEIYTHVSRRKLIDIKSPIEDLDLK